jgi:hypothetical protein
VRPGVRADRHPGFNDLLGYFRIPHRVLADLKERGFQTLIGQRLEHRRRVPRPGAVVEGQDDLLVAQEVVLFECSKPKPRPPVVSISTMRERPIPPGLSHPGILLARLFWADAFGAGELAAGAGVV